MLTRTIAVSAAIITAMLTAAGIASADGWGTIDCSQAQTPQCQLEVGESNSPPAGSSQDPPEPGASGSAPSRDRNQPRCAPGATCSATGVIRNPVQVDDVSPERVARLARAQLGLPTPAVAASPAHVQLVNLPTWFWLTGGWEAVSATATVPAMSVTVVAHPRSVAWATGDGGEVVCAGPGTPFPTEGDPRMSSPDCGHTYRQASASQPGDVYPVAVTVHWSISWSGGGSTGTLPDLTTAASTTFRVVESQALNVPGPR